MSDYSRISAIECPPPVFAIVLTSSIHLPVILKDVHPPSRPQSMPLDAIVTNINPGPPAKFYKSPHTETLVNAFRAEGSCARVVLEDGAGPQEKKNFERFRSRLQAGELVSLNVVLYHTKKAELVNLRSW